MANETNPARTLGETLVDLLTTMEDQFRDGTVQECVDLSKRIHVLYKLCGEIRTQHDNCLDSIQGGQMGAEKQKLISDTGEFVSGKINYVRKPRSDKKAPKAKPNYSDLNF